MAVTTATNVPPALSDLAKAIEEQRARFAIGARIATEAADYFESQGADVSHARRNAERSVSISFYLALTSMDLDLAMEAANGLIS